MEERKTTHGLIVALAFLVLAVSPPTAAAVGPPEECLAYAFSQSDDHFFLARDGAVMYGSNLTVVHDCSFEVVLEIDGAFVARSNQSFEVPIEPGNFTIGLVLNNTTITHEVELRPDRLQWSIDWTLFIEEGTNRIDGEEAIRMQNWAAAMTGLIVWVLSVYVYWNLVNAFVQRNFVEEVIA